MLLPVPDVLTPEQVARRAGCWTQAEWVDGRVTAGHQSARAKHNMQLPEGSPAARQLGDMVLAALQQQRALPLRRPAAARLPAAVQPLRGRAGVRHARGQRRPAGRRARRTGCAPTSRRRCSCRAPDEYDGGELVVEDTYGVHSVKLPAGHLVLYPASSLHHVRPVTRGARAGLVLLDPEHGARRRRSARCCSTSTRPSSGSSRDAPDHPVGACS